MNLDTDLTAFANISSRWIRNLSVKRKTVKLLEDSTGGNLADFGIADNSLDVTPQARSPKERIDRLAFIKVSSFCFCKNTVRRVKRDRRLGEVSQNVFSFILLFLKLRSKLEKFGFQKFSENNRLHYKLLRKALVQSRQMCRLILPRWPAGDRRGLKDCAHGSKTKPHLPLSQLWASPHAYHCPRSCLPPRTRVPGGEDMLS